MMEFSLSVFIILILCASSQADGPCGDWISYKNEECIKIIDHSALQSKADADIVCRAFADPGSSQDIPRLVTVKTKEKQDFLEKYLFKDQGLVDNVWLGLEIGETGVYRWNDGSELYFTNWQNETAAANELHRKKYSSILPIGRNARAGEHNCVQMDSGEIDHPLGIWIKANCKASVRIVCEKRQTWSISTLQNALLNFELEFSIYKKDTEQKMLTMKQEAETQMASANQKIDAVKQEADQKANIATQELTTLKQNPVPVGFIYVQLPGQQAPLELWPGTNWGDVSATFAGLFFRVEGGAAAAFGEEQADNARQLMSVQSLPTDETPADGLLNLPEAGTWSGYLWSGTDQGVHHGMRFLLAAGEVRPRNKAVKVWQRINNE